MDNPRIDELRRRVQKDPASIAFAQLAEEYRRIGDYEEAVRVCEAGLVGHPAYVSARVTLGRALLALGRLEDAAAEFGQVLQASPDNLVALRHLAEIHQRTRKIGHARDQQRVSEIPSSAPEQGTPAADPLLIALEAWLAVIGERRLARRH